MMSYLEMFEDMSEKKSFLFVSIIFVIILTISFFPFLFADRIFTFEDAISYYYPAFDFYSHALHEQESFLWNSYVFSGFPTYLSQSAGFFDPLNLILFRLFDAFDAYHIRLLIDLLLAFLFSYLASRSLGISKTSSILTGPAFLSAYYWGYLSNVAIMNSTFIMPFLIWAGLQLSFDNKKRYFWAAMAGVGIGWSILAGYAQPTIYAAILFSLFILLDRVYVHRAFTIRSLCDVVGLIVTSAIFSIACALPQVLAALTFTPLTVRAQGLSYDSMIGKVINIGDSILFLFPDYLYFPYISGGRRPLFIGAFLFFAAVFASYVLIQRWWRRLSDSVLERRMHVILGLFLFCFLAAIAHSPLFYVLNKLPVLSYFRFPYRWMYVGVWLLAVLGAYGFDYLRADPRRYGLKMFTSFLALGGVVGFTVVAALNFFGEKVWMVIGGAIHLVLNALIYGRFGFTKDPSHYRDAIARGIEAWCESLSILEPAFLLPFTLLLCGIVLMYLYSRERISPARFTQLGFILAALTFPVVTIVQWPNTVSRELTTYHSKIVNEASTEDRAQYRTFPFMIADGFGKYVPPQYTLTNNETQALKALQFASGWPSINMFGGVASIDGYDPFVSVRYMKLLEAVGSSHGGGDGTRTLSAIDRQERLLQNLDIVGLLSGKYIYSGVLLTHKDLKLITETPVSRYGIPLYVYENSLALPRAYYARAIVHAPAWSIEKFLEEAQNFERQSYLDCNECVAHPQNTRDSLTFEAKGGNIRINTNTKSARWLIIGESYLPGWRATVDEVEVSIFGANGVQMAVEIPPGEHEVNLEYEGIRGELKWLKRLGLVL